MFNTPGDPSSGIVSSAIGTGALTFNGGTLQAGGNFTLANATQINSTGGTIDANGFTFTHAGTIGDTPGHIGNLTITDTAGGAGVVVLSGNNTYTGGTLVTGGGTVQVTNANSVGTGDVTLDNGKFQADGLTNLTFTNNFKVNTTGGAVDNNGTVLTLSGIISNGNGNTGELQLTNSVGGFGTTVLSGVNTYGGGTKVVGAAVMVTNNSSVGTGTVTLQEGLFIADGVSDLTFANNFKLNTGANDSAIDANGVTLTISGVIGNGNGAGKLSILDNSGGFGKVVFLGANTYTGDTTICACATLQLGDATHTSAINGRVFNEGYLDIVNANTSGLTSITTDGGETISTIRPARARRPSPTHSLEPRFSSTAAPPGPPPSRTYSAAPPISAFSAAPTPAPPALRTSKMIRGPPSSRPQPMPAPPSSPTTTTAGRFLPISPRRNRPRSPTATAASS